jgi:GTP-binding protein LepA
VDQILEHLVTDIPAPRGDASKPPRALIFDSKYDEYKGVVAYIRVVDGSLGKRDKITFLATKFTAEALDTGYLKPTDVPADRLQSGEIGYIVTGLKDIAAVRVGDTIAHTPLAAETKMLEGYKEVRPMVYAGIFPKEGNEYERLRDAIMKLQLSDAALTSEPEHSTALGFGFRCGMLGMLHLEIVQERLRREHNMEVVVTTPSVAYEVTRTDGTEEVIKSPLAFPDPSRIEEAREPWVAVSIVCPSDYIGNVMGLIQDRRGVYKTTDYYDPTRAVLHYDMPLSSVIVDFHDRLKSASAGYASMNYELIGYRPAPIVRLDILVAEEPVAAFATLIHEDEAYRRGKGRRGDFEGDTPASAVRDQTPGFCGRKGVGLRANLRIPKGRDGVLVWRRRNPQNETARKAKEGKKRMMSMGVGSVDIPSDAFIKVLKRKD